MRKFFNRLRYFFFADLYVYQYLKLLNMGPLGDSYLADKRERIEQILRDNGRL